MTTAILVAGLVVTLLVAYVMRRPESRLAALLFAFLAIPGNLDNLLPQMLLDPHAIPNNTAPAVSFVDLLIVWGVILTLREGRFRGWPRELLLLVVLVGAFGILSAVVTVLNVFQGVELPAAVRGILVMARVPALLGLAIALRDTIGDGKRVAVGMTLGLVGLIGNGLYTSGQLETTRFTAATFGHNGFSLALVTGALVATGLAIDFRRRGEGGRVLTIACFALAAAGLFGAIATGTRMSLLVAIPAMLVALLVNRSWWHRRGAIGVAMLATGVLAVALAATLWTAEGGRALSGITDPGETVDIITDPDSASGSSSVRTRTRWWSQAIAMARDDPLTGVGPYQWNILRYETDHEAKPVVADPHNTYIQIAAEYGLPVLGAYLLGLAALTIVVLLTAWRPSSPTYRSTIATAIAGAALMIPVTELTNSHLFNVRLGAVAWLLLGVTLTLTVAPVLAARASSTTARMSAAEPDVGLGDQASRATPES